jgi:hypothetical protein
MDALICILMIEIVVNKIYFIFDFVFNVFISIFSLLNIGLLFSSDPRKRYKTSSFNLIIIFFGLFSYEFTL